MGAVMAHRLAWFHVNRMFVWVVPGLAGLATTAYLAWGAWITAHDQHWLALSSVWWRTGLRPGNDTTLLVAVLVWLTTWAAFWWPRRKQNRTVGLITIAAMVAVGAVLGTSALAPCRGDQTRISVVGGVLGLYVGNPPTAYGTNVCPGQAPLALQLGQIICLGATLIGVVGAAATLWRGALGPGERRFVEGGTHFPRRGAGAGAAGPGESAFREGRHHLHRAGRADHAAAAQAG